MDNKKIHQKILWLSLGICLVLYFDVFFIPSKYQSEVVTSRYKTERKRRKYRGVWYWVETEKGKYGLSPAVYNGLNEGDTITIVKSALTKSKRRIQMGNTVYGCDVGFIQNSGLVYLSFISMLTVIFMIFYEKIKYVPGRKHLTIYIAISTLILLSLHLIR